MNAKTETVTLDAEDREYIIDVLLLGLACLGEVQKAITAFDVCEQINGERPKWFALRDPDGPGDGTSRFANALQILQ